MKNYTHVTLVVDRSGSMGKTREEAQGGINHLLESQFAQEGALTVTLVEFDDEFNTVKRFADEPFEYVLKPRGMTALYDAIGREIAATKADLKAIPKALKPDNVLFVIVTDGGENSSREYAFKAVKAEIAKQEEAGWTFQFIGAGLHAKQGVNLGIRHNTSYVASGAGSTTLYNTLDETISTLRSTGVYAMAESTGE